MLSAYETGRQLPSLASLYKLLETLQCDLCDLHQAMLEVEAQRQSPLHRRLLSGQRKQEHVHGA